MASSTKSVADPNRRPWSERSHALSPAQHSLHGEVGFLSIAAGGVSLAECTQHLFGSARSDDERVGLRSAEDVERPAYVVVGMQHGRRQMGMAAIGSPVAPVFKGLCMRLGDLDQPLMSPILIYRDNDIGAANRIGFAETAD